MMALDKARIRLPNIQTSDLRDLDAVLAKGSPLSVQRGTARASLDLNGLERPALLFGDETSFGLAHALRFTSEGAANVELLLEVTSLRAAERALEAVGVTGAHLVERRLGDAHLGAVEETAEALLKRHAFRSSALSGKATSIQKLNHRLRSLGLSRQQIRTKAYWAPGKKGLD